MNVEFPLASDFDDKMAIFWGVAWIDEDDLYDFLDVSSTPLIPC
jgi:hypothetical protein